MELTNDTFKPDYIGLKIKTGKSNRITTITDILIVESTSYTTGEKKKEVKYIGEYFSLGQKFVVDVPLSMIVRFAIV